MSMSKSSVQKRSDANELQPGAPVYSDEVEKWRKQKKNKPYLHGFYIAVDFLNSDENRVRRQTSNGYDYRRKLSHMHIDKKIAIFYRYIENVLYIVSVLSHYGDKNYWKPH